MLRIGIDLGVGLSDSNGGYLEGTKITRAPSALRVLLTFAGPRDPFNPDDLVADQRSDGPVLTLLAEERFDRIYLFADSSVTGNAQLLATEIKRRYPVLKLKTEPLEFSDPTDYETIFYELNQRCRAILISHTNTSAEFFISTASGTPQIHTVWFLLAQSGLVPATLLKIVPARFRRGGRAVSQIRLSLSEFPRVSPGEIDALELASLRLQKEALEAEREAFFKEVEDHGIVGRSDALRAAFRTAMKAAAWDDPILLLGEPGTGKELFAQALHKRSPRSSRPLISVNSAALSSSLLEDELFGHVKGAFTNANTDRKGAFELAHGGTLFLDEIGDLPPTAQGAILRAIENGEVRRLGSEQITRVNVRLIAATNKDLPAAIAREEFRADLYFRLKGVQITLPSLRERREDIPLLIEHFLRALPSQQGGNKTVTKHALRVLLSYGWPGNVRELKFAVSQMARLSEGKVIDERDIPQDILRPAPGALSRHHQVVIPPHGVDLSAYLESLERAHFEKAIQLAHGNHAAAARLLRLQPHTFRKRAREKFGL